MAPRLISGPVPVKRPPPPPPPLNPRRGAGGINRGKGNPNQPGRASRANRTLIADRAVANVRNALMEKGMNATDASKYAKLALTQPHVTLGKGGSIFYKGRRFNPAQFAQSGLVNYVTGKRASTLNQKAITGDAGYQATLAQLALARDQGNAALEAQRRDAEIQFGDPSFVQGDPLTAGAALANPNSTVALLNLQKQRADAAAGEAANRAGTYYGGGLQSGLAENQRVNVAQNQDAVTKLQQLLSQIGTGIGNANQTYAVGQNNAYQQAYQDMLKAGTIHAAAPPNLSVGGFHYNFPQPQQVHNPGNNGPPPPPPIPPGWH